ncbi:hypothetical protein HPP92_008440 [Vanilla planifolia]|uniref:Auxin response factor n=1 Tax=Vanilla planifolia TaxID=51239 RepID=A0A835RE24_VANPL|nr:hypothetical protein HPP92_008618 [Vanilla planifolia]KAG0486345.1 hypothetical protein HPP92_008440 [Vanilla planifolia]
MKDTEKCLDSQLWHACAGGMVQMPPVNSKVYYFPQGHMEHAQTSVDFTSIRIPPYILSRVISVKYMADPETDEVFAKVRMVPLRVDDTEYGEDDAINLRSTAPDLQEKPTSFAKTLTQSDANNGGGFSVPRYCAETIFPRLDYSADPPVQTVLAKDVHGKVWKFRHIYRGTPRRHLLTTGWSNFVNEKKLVAGDSIVFLRTDTGDLCVGIRRAKREIGGGPEPPSGWNHSAGNCMYGGFSVFLRQEENGLHKGNASSASLRAKGKVKAESVIEAATLAATWQPFEVVYYPRASTPEFAVKASLVKAAMKFNWCSGMRFKMAFETEDSSRISWFMGTVSLVKYFDSVRWLGSPWRILQVSWDEPDLLQNVKCVSPWLVELVSNMPSIHLAPFSSPPKKKPRIPSHPDFPMDVQLQTPPLTGNPLIPSSSPLCCLPHGTPAVGIQGARHSQYGISLPDLHFGKLQSERFHTGFPRFNHSTQPPRIHSGHIAPNPVSNEDLSSLLALGNPSQSVKKECSNLPHFILFGKPIFTAQQLSLCTNSSSDLNSDKNISDGSGSATHQSGMVDNSSSEEQPYYLDLNASELVVEIGHCKVFMESEDVGRTLDLSAFGSYDELYRRLANMFGIEKLELISRILYRDTAGVVKHTGDEPFAEFMKVARRLTILLDSSCDEIGKSEENRVTKFELGVTAACPKLGAAFM